MARNFLSVHDENKKSKTLNHVSEYKMLLKMCKYLLRRKNSASIFITYRNSHKVLFFGTDEFSLPTLELLHKESESENGCVSELKVCCSQMKHLVSKVKSFSLEHPELQFPSYPPRIEDLDGFDVGVVASFGHLIPGRIISAFPKGVLNVHGSLLPKWRGAAPVAHALANGDTITGVSIMEIAPKKFDIGALLAQRSIKIDRYIMHPDLSCEMAQIGAELMMEVLRDLDHYQRNKILQNDSEATYAPIIDKSVFKINWNEMTSESLWNHYRGFSLFGKFHSTWLDTGVNVRFDQMLSPDELESILLLLEQEAGDNVRPGRALYVKTRRKERRLCIRCKSGWVGFEKFYYANKKVMTPVDFFNGFMSKYQKLGKQLHFGDLEMK